MTYRRLFIFLCFVDLLALAGTWRLSLRYNSGVEISLSEGTVMAFGLFSGGISCHVQKDRDYARYWSFDRYAMPMEEIEEMLRAVPTIHHSPLGKFDVDYDYVEVPLWFLYLVFVAIVYLVLRRPMRKQRLLEQQATTPSNSQSGE